MASPLSVGIYLMLAAISGVLGSCPVVSRAEWGARPPVKIEPLPLPVRHVVIHHTYIPPACPNATLCMAAMRAMQDMHQTARGWNDIGYSFCVGGDGQVYEGRGWDRVGAHAPKYNDKSIGICLIGDYRSVLPSEAMMQAVHRLVECGVERGVISPDYQLIGHRQVRDTECPGGALFREIQTWPHFSPLATTTPPTPTPTTTTTSVTVEDPEAPDLGVQTETANTIATDE